MGFINAIQRRLCTVREGGNPAFGNKTIDIKRLAGYKKNGLNGGSRE